MLLQAVLIWKNCTHLGVPELWYQAGLKCWFYSKASVKGRMITEKNLKINSKRIFEMCNQDAWHWSKNFSSMFCTWKWKKQHIQENDIWDLRAQWIPLGILLIFSWNYCVLEFSDSLTGSKSTSDSPLMKLTSNTMHISSLQRVFSIAAPNLREVGETWEYVSKLLQGNVIAKKKS